MAVVPFPMDLSPQGPNPSMSWELRSISARHVSPLNGVATTLERPGAHWAVRMPYENLAEERRARFLAWLSSMRGHANRTYVPVYGWTRRGSFPATELLTNNVFASGTTGWTTSSQTITASDGLLRSTRVAHDSTADLVAANSAGAITVTQYAPYAARCIDHQGRSTLWSSGPQLGSAAFGEEYGRANATGFGLKTLVSVIPATTAYFGLVDYNNGANVAGDYIEYSYTSLARCALVDNGPNFTQYSDAAGNAYWTKTECSATDGGGDPEGGLTGDIVQENGATAQHVVTRTETRTSAVADWCIFGVFQRAAGTRNIRLFVGRDSSNGAGAIFDLGAGTILVAASASGDATNARAFIKSMGGGHYYCAVIGQLTATTGLYLHYELADGSTLGYAGDSTSGVSFWRCGAAQSSVPTRGMQTTSAGDADGTLQTGSGLHLKGLPASTSGLLLQGDPVEIVTGTTSQLVRVRGSLNSDAAGMGYMQFEPPLRVSPSDNAAVIIQNPLCKMGLDSNVAGWTDRVGGFADTEISCVEDTFPS